MLKKLLEVLICPACLPQEYPFKVDVREEAVEDIHVGELFCPNCNRVYEIRDGIAFLDLGELKSTTTAPRYESERLMASYIWSHYGDLMAEPEAGRAYSEWGELLSEGGGWGLDIGAAVGRFSYEMSRTCDFVVGVDTSASFVGAARQLSQEGSISIKLPEEGNLWRRASLQLPQEWAATAIEFIVADAQALPFKTGIFRQAAALNLVDKLPRPLLHLSEMNRVVRNRQAQFVFSDPFSWSLETAPEKEWLGGSEGGNFAGYGLDNVRSLLQGQRGLLQPAWRVVGEGALWWKIRTHRNHYELIRSCYLQAER